MITITSDAARELLALASRGDAATLRFDAVPDGEGAFDCSVGLVADTPPEARVEEISGVTVAFCGMAESVFAGATVALNAEGAFTLEMAEAGCDGCGHGCDCGDDGSCDVEGHCH